jgi:hypothetical protein
VSDDDDEYNEDYEDKGRSYDALLRKSQVEQDLFLLYYSSSDP